MERFVYITHAPCPTCLEHLIPDLFDDKGGPLDPDPPTPYSPRKLNRVKQLLPGGLHAGIVEVAL